MFKQIITKAFILIQFRTYAKRVKEIAIDPGIKRRGNIFPKNATDMESFDFEDFDTDFSNLADVYDEDSAEKARSKDLLEYRIVKRKYFRNKLPNFLTWSEKEQIRHLFQNNQTECSPESLADSFPALPETILKIIKAKWSPKNQNRIRNHDENVLKNWKQFRDGQFNNLPKDLVNHLKKFTNRPENVSDEVYNLNAQRDKPNVNVISGKTEFRNIIRDYKSQIKAISSDQSDNTDKKTEIEVIVPKNQKFFNDKNQTLLMNKKTSISRKEVTLDQLRHNLLQNSHKLPDNEKQFLHELSETTEQINSLLNPAKVPSVECDHTEPKTPNIISYEVPRLISYPNKIFIPKHKRKRGATYKVNDCFYDSDGDFLYRVIGM